MQGHLEHVSQHSGHKYCRISTALLDLLSQSLHQTCLKLPHFFPKLIIFSRCLWWRKGMRIVSKPSETVGCTTTDRNKYSLSIKIKRIITAAQKSLCERPTGSVLCKRNNIWGESLHNESWLHLYNVKTSSHYSQPTRTTPFGTIIEDLLQLTKPFTNLPSKKSQFTDWHKFTSPLRPWITTYIKLKLNWYDCG